MAVRLRVTDRRLLSYQKYVHIVSNHVLFFRLFCDRFPLKSCFGDVSVVVRLDLL
jgi:hypothetical protein